MKTNVTIIAILLSSGIVIGTAALLGHSLHVEGTVDNVVATEVASTASAGAEEEDAWNIVNLNSATAADLGLSEGAEAEASAELAEAETVSDGSDIVADEASDGEELVVQTIQLTDLSAGETGVAESYVEENPEIDGELAYLDKISAEDIESIKGFMSAQPDIDGEVVKDFFIRYSNLFSFFQDENGEYLVLADTESLMQSDIVRPGKSVEMGLNKNPIDDALAFPYDLTEEQVKKVLATGLGKKADFAESEITLMKAEMFQFLLGSPIGLEAYIKLLNSQKIADQFYLNEYWSAGNEYLERCQEARKNGEGLNIWYRQMVDPEDGTKKYHFTTEEYHKYVVALFNLLWPRKAEVAVYTAKAGDHYHLIAGDLNSMRQATPADYSESLASLIFPFYTKTGKIAFRFGSNLRDKRPEVLNYSAVKKPVVKPKVTPAPTPVPVVTPVPVITWQNGVPVTTWVNSTPDPTPTPENPPGPPSNPPEYKAPSEGTDAGTGGGKKSDSGPGEYKPDQGNGNGEYQPGTSENPDGGKEENHDSGPAADNTDGGDPPASDPIPEHDSGTEKGDAGGEGGGAAGDNKGSVSEPPATDD